VSLLLFLPSLFLRDLWKPDEPRYAQVSREMVDSGEWIVPHLNGKTYAHKPPLVFWFGAAARNLGLGANGGRLASMLAALGTILLTASLGRRWFTPVSSVLAGLILATTFEFGWMGRSGGLDAPLTFFTTLAVYAYVAGGPLLPILYIAAGLAVLVKGPVGILFVLLGVVSIRIARAPAETRGWRHLLWGVPLMLAVIAAWVVPACILGGEAYTQELLFKQNVGRAVNSWSHQRPFYYHIAHLPEMFAPWSIIAIFATWRAWLRRKKDPAILAMLLWFGLALLLFSMISGKRTRYLLPVFPAFALVVARGIEAGYLAVIDRSKAVWMRRAVILQSGTVMVVAAAFGILAAFGGFMLDRFAEKNPIVVEQLRWIWDGPWHWLVLLGMGIVGTLAYRGMRAAIAWDARRATVILVLTAVAGWMAGDFLLLPIMNPLKSPVAVTRRVDELFPHDGTRELRAFFDAHHGAYAIYSRQRIWTIETDPHDAVAFLKGGPDRALFVSRRDLDRHQVSKDNPSLQELLSPDWSICEVGRVGSNVMLLVSNFEIESLRRINTRLRK